MPSGAVMAQEWVNCYNGVTFAEDIPGGGWIMYIPNQAPRFLKYDLTKKSSPTVLHLVSSDPLRPDETFPAPRNFFTTEKKAKVKYHFSGKASGGTWFGVWGYGNWY